MSKSPQQRKSKYYCIIRIISYDGDYRTGRVRARLKMINQPTSHKSSIEFRCEIRILKTINTPEIQLTWKRADVKRQTRKPKQETRIVGIYNVYFRKIRRQPTDYAKADLAYHTRTLSPDNDRKTHARKYVLLMYTTQTNNKCRILDT